jgi:hypothetical protein
LPFTTLTVPNGFAVEPGALPWACAKVAQRKTEEIIRRNVRLEIMMMSSTWTGVLVPSLS